MFAANKVTEGLDVLLRLALVVVLAPSACTFADGDGETVGAGSSVQVAHARTTRSMRRRDDLRIETTVYEPVPTIIDEVTIEHFRRSASQRVVLAGDRAGMARLSIDNFILFEVYEPGQAAPFGMALVGMTDQVLLGDRVVPQVGPSGFHFEAGQVDLTELFPADKDVRVRVTALDYGSVVFVSDVFLITRDAT